MGMDVLHARFEKFIATRTFSNPSIVLLRLLYETIVLVQTSVIARKTLNLVSVCAEAYPNTWSKPLTEVHLEVRGDTI